MVRLQILDVSGLAMCVVRLDGRIEVRAMGATKAVACRFAALQFRAMRQFRTRGKRASRHVLQLAASLEAK